MSKSHFGSLLIVLVAMVLAVPAVAYKVKEPRSPLDKLQFEKKEMRISRSLVDSDRLSNFGPRNDIRSFRSKFGSNWKFLIDRRTGALNLLDGGAIPFLPGPANQLSWEQFGAANCRAMSCLPASKVESLARDFLMSNRSALQVNPEQLVLDPVSVAPIGNSIYFLRFQWMIGRVPVEGGSVFFAINNGNLIQLGVQNVGPIHVDTNPAITPDRAWEVVRQYAGTNEKDQIIDRGTLVIEPITPKGLDPDGRNVPFGRMIDYVLVYKLAFRRPGLPGTWVALVDAHTGELLRFRDENRYGHIQGGVYKTDAPQTEVSSPFAKADYGAGYADANGDYPALVGTSTLNGNPVGGVRITDTCGSISLASGVAGLIDFGSGAGTDCTTPGSGGVGNTHASRTQYWNVTAIKTKGLTYLPTNTWLQGQLGDLVNMNATCNAFWDGVGLNFYKSGGGCGNSGELPGVSLHEWGHGMDSNDGSGGGTDNRPVESRADWTALLQTHGSCAGAGFFTSGNCGGYGDACSACSGIRDADWARHASNTPWTPQNEGTVFTCFTSGYAGPCGWEDHCESGIATQALWDFVNRDLVAPPTSLDLVSAWQLEDRLFYTGMPQSTDMYTCTGTPKVSDGCAAGSLYNVMRAVDDDGDGTANGTPHAAAIYAALSRHNIGCGAAGDPQNQNQTSCPALTTPTLTATATNHDVTLNWTTGGASATRYFVYRNETSCSSGFTKIATVTAPTLTYTDALVVHGQTYYYRVQAATANDSCVSPMSACTSVTVSVAADSDFYVRDWTNTTMVHDNGEEPSTNATFWYSSDVWNKATNAAGSPNGSGWYDTDPMQSGSGSLGNNYAFVRVHRNTSGSAATVNAHFFVSPFGTGSAFQDAAATADPSIPFAAADTEVVLGSGYLWNQPTTSSTHACLAVQIYTPGDPYQAPTLLGQTPGPGDYIVIDDNNKAQRNLDVSHNTFHFAGMDFALIHNAALYPRDLMLRVDTPAAESLRGATIEVVGGERYEFRPGATLTLPAMQPGENRWIAIRHQVPQGAAVPIHFADVDKSSGVNNGFTVLASAVPVGDIVRENLRNHVQVFNRLRDAFDAPGANATAVAAQKLVKRGDVTPSAYLSFLNHEMKAIDMIVAKLDSKANAGDSFGAMTSIRALGDSVKKKNAEQAASEHAMLLNRLDSYATMLQKSGGDAADILQMVRWQEALYRTRPALQRVACSDRVVKASQAFINASSRRLNPDAYASLLKSLDSCYRDTARSLANNRQALETTANAIGSQGGSVAAMEKQHRQLLLALQDAVGAVQP